MKLVVPLNHFLICLVEYLVLGRYRVHRHTSLSVSQEGRHSQDKHARGSWSHYGEELHLGLREVILLGRKAC